LCHPARPLAGGWLANGSHGLESACYQQVRRIVGEATERCTNKQLRLWSKHGLIRLERAAVVILRRDKLAEVAAQGSELNGW